MNQERIKQILQDIKKVKVAVYGDFCLDVYWQMNPEGSEVSVETQLKAEAVDKQSYSPGGAGNIVANMAALHPAAIKVIGVVGKDIFGRELASKLEALGADTTSLITQEENFSTYTYIKKMNADQEDPRIDFGLSNNRSKETDLAVLKTIKEALETYDVFIFNQQVVGSITNDDFINQVNSLFAAYKDKIIVLDSRHYNDRFQNVCRKSNEIETAVLNGIDAKPHDFISLSEVKAHGKAVYNKFKKPLFVTCGNRGVLAFDDKGIHVVPGILLSDAIDTVGAGDTSLSAISLCLAAGVSPNEAAEFANFSSAITVQKRFTTGTASGEEILEIAKSPDYYFNPHLSGDIRLAKYYKQTEFEICDDQVLSKLGNIKHIVFDHDGTISTQREGWEAIMQPVMIKAVLGKQYNTASKELYDTVRDRVLHFIDRSTGIQTIVQMEGLVNMVKEFNFVDKREILDKFGYKEIYNDGLMEMVNARIDKLESGQLTVPDFTMKGAVSFLNLLKKKGIKLYLASGTDEEDVINEAKSLGYDTLFDGGIYGSVGDISKYSKKMVIEKIISENNLNGNELMVIGDGPVEIKEGRKAGGISVGIASDEVRRYGLNLEKRTRLIKAGAHILISDFSQAEALIDLLFSQKK